MSVKYSSIDLEDAVGKYSHCIHSSHIFLWTKDNSFRNKEVIYGLMQMRSDGLFGFPGGKSDKKTVDQNEIVSSLYRELKEEIGFIPFEGQITIEDLVSSYLTKLNGSAYRVRHFFVKELPLLTFKTVERTHTNAPDFPKESLGLIRIPLKKVGHSTYKPFRKFFANFGKQCFASISRLQLIESVAKFNLIGESDLKFFLKKMKKNE